MSKFRVGQRVRIVGTEYHGPGNGPCGQEATIEQGPGAFKGPWSGIVYTWIVMTVTGRRIWANSEELEPATDSYDVVSWDTCVWKPEHLRVGA